MHGKDLNIIGVLISLYHEDRAIERQHHDFLNLYPHLGPGVEHSGDVPYVGRPLAQMAVSQGREKAIKF